MGRHSDEVGALVAERRLLALTTSDGISVIPRFQLDTELKPIASLSAVLQILTEDIVDPWTLAAWLLAPRDLLGTSIVEFLRAGGDESVALSVATQARTRWAA